MGICSYACSLCSMGQVLAMAHVCIQGVRVNQSGLAVILNRKLHKCSRVMAAALLLLLWGIGCWF